MCVRWQFNHWPGMKIAWSQSPRWLVLLSPRLSVDPSLSPSWYNSHLYTRPSQPLHWTCRVIATDIQRERKNIGGWYLLTVWHITAYDFRFECILYWVHLIVLVREWGKLHETDQGTNSLLHMKAVRHLFRQLRLKWPERNILTFAMYG